MTLVMVMLVLGWSLVNAAPVRAGVQQHASMELGAAYGLQAQPGEVLLSQIARRASVSSSEIVTVINDTLLSGELTDYSSAALRQYPEQVRYLLDGLRQHKPLIELLRAKMSLGTDEIENTILAGFALYPIESYQLLQALENDERFSAALIEAVAKRAGLDHGRRFLASIATDDVIKIQPLFHSASVTLFNQPIEHRAEIAYREQGESEWQPGLALQWDPVREALSGSIVHLQPGTQYEVAIRVFKGQQQIVQQSQRFNTKANSPPIDADKVYQLSDIYHGGRLDLEALNIEGSAQGWAKIVGDENTPIIAGEQDNSAIKIGNNSYILFENITVVGGRKNAINSYKAHHLWFNGCNISGWGRAPNIEKNGQFFETEQDTTPINYDSAFALMRTGVVVVEHCTVHSPRAKASHWGNGHPMGPNAFLAWANHPDPDFKGQVVIRHNRFFGSPQHRFNDVIEGDSNPRMWGGFVRDSAIYNNYFAYANDDVVELDGGQSNVLFYNNEVEQGYCGVSAIPNQLGPSYIFNNHIHNLGDERGSAWAGIKLGGAFSAPAGRTLIFENLIVNNSANGIAGARFAGDYSYWAWAHNNILLNQHSWENKGYGIIDKSAFATFTNNLIYNNQLDDAKINAVVALPFHTNKPLDDDFYQPIFNSEQHFYPLAIGAGSIPNFSQPLAEGVNQIGITRRQ